MGNETVICPYCGSEMQRARFSGEPHTWYQCTNPDCSASSPIACGHEEAYQKAMCRYRPMLRPMTPEEVKAHIGWRRNRLEIWAMNPKARPLYVELREGSELKTCMEQLAAKEGKTLYPWVRTDEVTTMITHKISPLAYGKQIRFWPDEPTEAEKSAAKWEDEEDETAGN